MRCARNKWTRSSGTTLARTSLVSSRKARKPFKRPALPTLAKATRQLLQSKTAVEFFTQESLAGPLLQFFLPLLLIGGVLVWMQRRAKGQMSGIMSIGEAAKTYTTERPASSFADVAGYEGVKQEITEVVDFLKEPDRFGEIGARIPKGCC